MRRDLTALTKTLQIRGFWGFLGSFCWILGWNFHLVTFKEAASASRPRSLRTSGGSAHVPRGGGQRRDVAALEA